MATTRFHSDGSLEIPQSFKNKIEILEEKGKAQKILLTKKIIKDGTPKLCSLSIESNKNLNNICDTFRFFRNDAETKSSIKKLTEKQFKIYLGTSHSRCEECQQLCSMMKLQHPGMEIEQCPLYKKYQNN